MSDLFSNEYFNRAWVIQEIAVGKNVELYVGGIYIPWMIFAQYVSPSLFASIFILLNNKLIINARVVQWCFRK